LATRPGRTYRRIKRPWTRISKRKPKLSYAVGVPDPKIHVFEMGNKKRKFDTNLFLVVEQPVQIRDSSLESSRISANKHLEKVLGVENYFMKVLVYPHQILREHTLATGAGADRFSMGMRKAFGRPKGRAAIATSGKRIMRLSVNKKHIPVAKVALSRANHKISSPCKIEIEPIKL
jgi:large subunit ribosomal protein L10e